MSIKELAKAKGAELPATRPVCDNGWMAPEMPMAVYTFGETVCPELSTCRSMGTQVEEVKKAKG